MYVAPRIDVATMKAQSMLDMSVTNEEFDNDQSLGKRTDGVGLEIVYEQDLWNEFWFGSSDETDENSTQSKNFSM